MQQLLLEGKAPKEIYEALAMTDERMVADLLRPIYDRTSGQDGFVSIEVSPLSSAGYRRDALGGAPLLADD